jgi:hypothetical protein
MTDDERPISLKEAAKMFGFPVSALRREHQRGRLAVYQPGGRKYYTTAADVREMVHKCRVEPKAAASISILREGNGSSATACASSALAAANETVSKLKSISRNTSRPSINRKRAVRP